MWWYIAKIPDKLLWSILVSDIETACCLLHLPHQLVDCTNTSAHYTVHSDSYIATVPDCLATAAKTLRRGWALWSVSDDTISLHKCWFTTFFLSLMSVAQLGITSLWLCRFLSPAHRYPLPPGRGHDRELHDGVQWTGPLGCLLDAGASLASTQQDQEPPETLHLRALPGEREPGTPGKRERQAGRRGPPVTAPALPQCLFQQWSRRQSGLPLGGDALECGLWIPTHVST